MIKYSLIYKSPIILKTPNIYSKGINASYDTRVTRYYVVEYSYELAKRIKMYGLLWKHVLNIF